MLDFVTLSKPLNIPDASMLGKLIEEFEHFRIPLPEYTPLPDSSLLFLLSFLSLSSFFPYLIIVFSQLTQNSATARTKEAAKLEWVASANRAEPSKPAVPSKRSEPSKPAPPKPRLIELRELEKPAKQAELLNCEEPPKPAEPARMLEPVQRAALLQLSASREAEGDYENGGHDNGVSYCNDSVHYNDDKYYNEDRYYNDDPFMHAQHCESFIEFQRLWYSGKRRIVELSGLPSARTEPKLAKLKGAELVNYEELAEPSNSAEHMEGLESAKHAEAATPEHIPNAARPARRSEPEERAEPEVEVEEPDHLESWKLDEMMSKLAELGMSCEPYSQELGFEAMTAEMDQLSHPLARNGMLPLLFSTPLPIFIFLFSLVTVHTNIQASPASSPLTSSFPFLSPSSFAFPLSRLFLLGILLTLIRWRRARGRVGHGVIRSWGYRGVVCLFHPSYFCFFFYIYFISLFLVVCLFYFFLFSSLTSFSHYNAANLGITACISLLNKYL